MTSDYVRICADELQLHQNDQIEEQREKLRTERIKINEVRFTNQKKSDKMQESKHREGEHVDEFDSEPLQSTRCRT